jgi:hypothetical protein
LIFWSQKYLNDNLRVSGFPQYIIAKKSPLGKVVFDKPFTSILVQAKQDNFEVAWTQYLTEIISAQSLNGEFSTTIFGIVSNGDSWQFGKLEKYLFIQDKNFYGISQLDKLFAAINYIFQQIEVLLYSYENKTF